MNKENIYYDQLDRSKPPKAGTPKDILFPEHFETTTVNGITVLVIENHKIPAVSVRLVFKNAGSYIDCEKHGLASLTAELLTKGTAKRTATEIAEEIDFLGASLTTGSDWDGGYVSLSCLKKHLENTVDVLADVVVNPEFKEEEIKRVKDQRISSILQGKDDPSNLSDKLFNRVVFDKHPYANPQEGSESSVYNLYQSDFKDFYNSHYTPDSLILAFVGSITVDEALKIVEEKFSKWHTSSTSVPAPFFDFNSVYSPKNVYIADKPDAVQSSLRIGHIGIERNNPDYIAVSVMNTILGGFFGSRINYILREKNGFTYGARSGFNSRIQKGEFSVDTEVRTEVTFQAIQLILEEIKKITDKHVGDEELQLVKNYLTGVFPLQLETANAVASRVINLKLYDLPKDYYNKYITNINNISKDAVLNAARKYLYPDNCYIVVSGDSKLIKKDLENLGNVNIYDADGKLVNPSS
ncbi:MAG TPA: pitrilysin family protein [Ignavibacteria bacterium]|jgi:zinc protease